MNQYALYLICYETVPRVTIFLNSYILYDCSNSHYIPKVKGYIFWDYLNTVAIFLK